MIRKRIATIALVIALPLTMAAECEKKDGLPVGDVVNYVIVDGPGNTKKNRLCVKAQSPSRAQRDYNGYVPGSDGVVCNTSVAYSAEYRSCEVGERYPACTKGKDDDGK